MTPDPETCFRIQRAASHVALRHVYGDEPYPDDAVLERWRTFRGSATSAIRAAAEKHGLSLRFQP